MNETDAYTRFKKSRPGWFKKLHGNRYQSGLPDIIWIHEGVTRFLEFKISDGLVVPWRKFRLNQHLTMREMSSHGAKVFYVIFVRENEKFYAVNPTAVVEEKGIDLSTYSVVD